MATYASLLGERDTVTYALLPAQDKIAPVPFLDRIVGGFSYLI